MTSKWLQLLIGFWPPFAFLMLGLVILKPLNVLVGFLMGMGAFIGELWIIGITRLIAEESKLKQ